MQDTAFLYIDGSIPAGMTIAEYRRARCKPEPPRHRLRRWLTPRPITVTA